MRYLGVFRGVFFEASSFTKPATNTFFEVHKDCFHCDLLENQQGKLVLEDIFLVAFHGNLFFDETQQRMIEMYRTIFVWLANTYGMDSTKLDQAAKVLKRMEDVIPTSKFKMDYRQSYQVAMLYNMIGNKQKFYDFAKIAEEGALIDKRSTNPNTSSFYNPYRILLDIYEAKGEYQKALNLLNELDQRDPSVNQKRESLKLKMSGGEEKK